MLRIVLTEEGPAITAILLFLSYLEYKAINIRRPQEPNLTSHDRYSKNSPHRHIR
jgi:hypothetical protein